MSYLYVLADCFLLIVQLIHISTALMGDLKDWPCRLRLSHIVRRRILRILHLDVKDLEVIAYVVETCRWFLVS